MSLVNDMLRDLDQRRKDSEGPAARIRLTPAGDYPRQERKNLVPYIAFGLVLVAAGLGYAWMQMNQGSTTQQLATAIPPVPVVLDPEEVVAAAIAEPVVATNPQPVAIEAPPAITVDDVLTAAAAQQSTAAPVSNSESSAASTVAVEQDAGATASSPVAATTDRVTANPVAAPNRVAATVRNSGATIAASEPIKDVSAPSPEQRDTLVVQEALRLFANNEPVAAYTALEKHLLDNPYAHQSRETYAKFLMNSGDPRSANALIHSGLQLAPNHSGFKKVKARLLIADGEIAAAVSLLESRAPAVASDLEYHEILASAQLAIRDFDGAALSYTSLVQQDQTQGRWWYGFAAAQDALGNVVAAQQAYTRAIEKPNLSTNLRRRSQDRLTALSQ